MENYNHINQDFKGISSVPKFENTLKMSLNIFNLTGLGTFFHWPIDQNEKTVLILTYDICKYVFKTICKPWFALKITENGKNTKASMARPELQTSVNNTSKNK